MKMNYFSKDQSNDIQADGNKIEGSDTVIVGTPDKESTEEELWAIPSSKVILHVIEEDDWDPIKESIAAEGSIFNPKKDTTNE